MKQANLFILAKDEPAVMRALGRLKLLHLEPARSDVEMPPRHEEDREKLLERSRRLLVRIEETLADFGLTLEGPREEMPHLLAADVSRRLKDIEAVRNEIRRQLDGMESEEKQIDTMIRDLRAFTGLGIPMERINDFSFLHFAIGQLPATSLAEIRERIGANVVLLPGPGEGNQAQLVAVTSKKGRFALETELERAGFEPEPVGPEQKGLADELVDRARERRARADVQRELATKLRDEKAAEYGPTLRAFRRTVVNDIRVIEAEANFLYTEAACYITGWVPAAEVNDMTEAVLEATGGRAAIDVQDPSPGSEPPSKFRQKGWLRPFTMLVAGYGFPKYREIEPTIFVAISFLLMFGFMFGDAGHGLVLLLAGLLARCKARSEKVRDIGFILLACGLSSMVFGAVYGSYFGFTHEKISWLPCLWQDPLYDVLSIMTVAVIGGSIMISVGLVFNIVNRLRSRDWAHGIFDKFGLVGAVMYWAALALALMAFVFKYDSLPVGPVLTVIVVGGVVLFIREPLLVFLKRRRGETAESIFEALIMAFVELLEVFINYLANSLSFMRLAAYAISHAALLLATFEMVHVVQNMAGAAGRPLGVVVYLVGNLIIILLEGLVAAIQAVRLEYYEFFGKFFSGTGRAYQPFESD